MKPVLFAIGVTSMLLCSPAHGETEGLFPVQGDVEVEVSSGSQLLTSTVYLDLSIVRSIAQLGGGWQLFAGAGFADDIVTYWQRDSYRAPDAIAAFNQPGIEGRLGLVHGNHVGAPRIVIKATPLWARSVDAMTLPGERGLGLRASAGMAWPAWLLGRIDVDDHSKDSGAPYALALAAFVPSEIEYVYTHVPGDDHHGVAFGWSF